MLPSQHALHDRTKVGWKRLIFSTLLTLLVTGFGVTLHAQGGVSLTIGKSQNAPTPVPSGQTFTYTISYSWSGGVPGPLVITDTIPSNLDIVSTVPASTVSGNVVQFTLTGLTGTAGAGTVQINVRFKPGVTCPDERACNTAWIREEGGAAPVKSTQVCATATATNKWTFEKTLFAGCALDNEVIFRICVKNPSGGNIGGLNLNDVTLSDIVPSGATVTGVSGSWSSFTQTGSNVTLTGGPSTLPVNAYNAWYCVYIKINFPSTSFSAGDTVTNYARLNFRTPCDDPQGEPTTWTDSATAVLCEPDTSGTIWKGLSLNLYFPSNPSYLPTFTPGCCGTYRVYYKNTGNIGQPNVTLTDNLPPEVDLNSIRTQVPSGLEPCTLKVYCYDNTGVCGTTACTTVVYPTSGTFTLSTVPANACKVEWEYSDTLAITQSIYNTLDVCVSDTSNAAPFDSVQSGDTITNMISATADNLTAPISTTHTKIVDGQTPKILATKLFMGECTSSCTPNTAGPFVPGDVVRWRMAVANIGNLDATLATITDNLPAGLSYVGNETYWYGSFNWLANQYNPNCCSLTTTVPTEIGGTITTPSLGDTALSWSFPVLPARCDGTVEYFIIEFDVKISDAPPAPPGQYPNTFDFDASNTGTTTSNTATLTVNATAQLQLEKGVRPLGSSGPFLTNATVPQSGQAEFELMVVNTGNMALQDLCLLDIMPHVGDIQVLPAYSARGSQFELPTTGTPATLLPGTGYTADYNSSANTKNPTRSIECAGFCGVADPTTGIGAVTNGVFTTTPSSTYSFKVTANSGVNLAPGDSLRAHINATIPAGAGVGETACNSFAVQATPAGTTTCLAAEAAPACVRVVEGQQEEPCDKIFREGRPDDCCGYTFGVSDAYGGLVNLQYNVLNAPGASGPSGYVQSVNVTPCAPTSTSPTSLAGTTSGSLTFDPACTQASPQQIGFTATPNTSSGEVCIEVIVTMMDKEQNKIECRDTICFRCDSVPVRQCDSMAVKPFPFHNLDLSGRTFKIFNQKIPASPICSVKVDVVPPPSGPGVNGGGLYIDGVWQSWPWGSSSGYSMILPTHGMPATNTVQFNLGVDYTIGWVGNVFVTSYHCDGDSCLTEYGPWKAEKGKPTTGGGVITGPKLSDSVRYYTLRMTPENAPQGTRYLSIDHADGGDSIVAISPASPGCDSALVAEGRCDDRITLVEAIDGTALVSLRRSSDRTGANDRPLDLTIFMLSDGDDKETVTVTFYGADGNELGTAEVEVTANTLTSDVPEEISSIAVPGDLRLHPNPTAQTTTASFRLDRGAHSVSVELIDNAGRHVRTIIDGETMGAGEHQVTIDTESLASGVYYMVLRTAHGSQSRRLVVQQ